MQKWVKLVLLFFLPILAIAIGMEVLLRIIPNRFQQQAELICSEGKNIETLILGSSHTQYGIDPQYLDSPAINLSNTSQTLDIDLQLLKQFEDDLPTLKTVVLRLSYATLFEVLEESNESWRLKDYNIYLGSELGKFSHQFEILSVSLKRNLERIVEYYFEDTKPFDGELLDSHLEGQTDIEQAALAVVKKHTIKDKKWLNDNIHNLQNIAEWAERRNIKILLITLPGYGTYHTNMEKSQIETTIEAGRTLDQTYLHLNYHNFLRDPRFSKDDFYDGDHLNSRGAKKFSEILNTLIEQ